MKIFFFSTAIEHTTFRKTVRALSNEGAQVHYAGFTRNNYPSTTITEFAITNLGTISHGNYFSRLLRAFSSFKKIRALAKQYDVIYCFSLDSLLICSIALLFKKKKWVYQVQDIRSVFFGSNFINHTAKFIENRLLKNVNLLVLSSADYYHMHFEPLYNFKKEKVRIVENKLYTSPFNTKEKAPALPIIFGYFGVLRCKQSCEILYKLALANKEKISIYIRGKAVESTAPCVSSSDLQNFIYSGPYRSPEDLTEIYSMVDIVWACYPFSNSNVGNWKMARTIRFYEALAYRKPVIVQKGTPQEEDVLKYDIGLVIDMASPAQTLEDLKGITISDLVRWHKNITSLPKEFMFHMDEYKNLVNDIQKL